MSEVIKLPLEGEDKGKYIFRISHKKESITITIPGHGGGRDGYKKPDFPEQEKWMRDHSDLKEIWYLTWECKDLKSFKRKLKKFTSQI